MAGLGGALLPVVRRADAQTPTPIAALYEPIDTATALFAGRDEGFFARAGVTVEPQPMNTGSAMIASAVSGSSDIVLPNVLSIAEAYAQGIPVRIIAFNVVYDARNPSTEMLVLNDAPVSSARDLNGKTIAVNVLNGLAWVAARAWIDQNGGDSRGVRFVEMPFGVMPDALTSKRVDAAVIAEPALGIAKRDSRVLAPVYSAIAPSFPIDAWVATTGWISGHADAARRFAAGMREARIWANANHDKSAELAASFMKLDAAVIRERTRATFAGRISIASAQPLLDAGAKYGVLKSPVKAADLTSPQVPPA